MNTDKPMGVPQLRGVTFSMLGQALRRGARDFVRAPLVGMFFAGIFVLGGWAIAWVSMITGTTFWMVLAAIGFPLIGPFAAVGLYEVSHRLEQGKTAKLREIIRVVTHQSRRQLPSICAIIVVVFMFWFFAGHLIFALFLGLSTMTNVMSSMVVFTTPSGLMMLAVGTGVGALFALLLYMITVLALPLLLDREIDFVTAMITSFQYVLAHPWPMLAWAAFVAVITFAALMPMFLGLLVALPLLGHASWHLYRQITIQG